MKAKPFFSPHPVEPQSAPPGRRRWRRRLVAIAATLVVVGLSLSIAVPRMCSRRVNANESAAIATLKNLCSAQSQTQASGFIDCNGNGQGEYGFLAEMAGAVAVRTSSGVRPSTKMDPPVLSARFGKITDGRVHTGGYVFQMFLPGKDGSWISEAGTGGAPAGVDTKQAEVRWICYAWPASRGWSGNRAFFVTEAGCVMACSMQTEVYNGDRQPLPGISGHVREGDGWLPAANTVDVRGNFWSVV